MKTCTQCRETKDITEFYIGDSNCTECRKAKVRAYREANIEAIRAYDRERGRGEARKIGVVIDRPKYKDKRPEYNKRWIEKNPEKRAAHIAVSNAVRDGALIKGTCEVCGKLEVEAHHDDYSKPLDVRWLCSTHHGETRRIDQPSSSFVAGPMNLD